MKTYLQFLSENTLTTKTRDEIPSSKFALSGRRYPIENAAHAKNAKARAKQELDKGDLSQEEYDTVVKKADAVLAKKDD